MAINDLVRVKGKRGRPEKFIVVTEPNNDLIVSIRSLRTNELFEVHEDRIAPYPVKKPEVENDSPN